MPYGAHFGTIERRIEHHATKADDAEQSCQIKCAKQELERAKLLISYKYRLPEMSRITQGAWKFFKI